MVVALVVVGGTLVRGFGDNRRDDAATAHRRQSPVLGGCGAAAFFSLFKFILIMTSFATCDLCDEHKNDTDGDFRVLPPVFKDYGRKLKFSGQVSTVKCFEDNTLVKAAVDSPGHGRVLVVDGGASLRRALVGGNLGKAAARNGWAGVLVDGCVRDSAELAECDVGIRALGLMPLPTEKRQEGQSDVAVQVQGVWVRPGDWLYADEDGIVLSSRPLI